MCAVCVTLIRDDNVDLSKCKRECTWRIKVYVGGIRISVSRVVIK